MAKILLVEDDNTLAEFVKERLVKQNHAVDIVGNGDDGLYWLSQGDYSLAVVDWNLPKMTGVAMCKSYRNSGGSTPILMLTGMNSSDNIIEGLDSGADDYLSKPFEIGPFLARIRALLRRPTAVHSTVLSGGGLELDLNNSSVTVNGEKVDLTPKEIALLELLMRNANNICTTEAVINYVWDSDATATRDSVRCVINRLRAKLESAGSRQGACIRSVYGMGYKFEC